MIYTRMQLQDFLAQHHYTAHTEKLAQYATLLRTWNPKINLVAPNTLKGLEIRHLLDSAQLAPHLSTAQSILDVGSGAGLPGLILAILLPDAKITVAERDQRKAAFLTTVRHQLGLSNVTIQAGDVRDLIEKNQRYQVITGRAFTETKNFLDMTQPLLAVGGHWLLLKGQAVSQELEGLPPMTITRTPSITESTGWVVFIKP